MKDLGRELKSAVLIVLGIFAVAFGIKGFLLSSHFIDGGVTGISMLLSAVTGGKLALFIPLINLPFIVLAFWQMGRRFALKSILAIAGLAAVLATVSFPDVTPDKLLTAVFGGFFIGAGIGLAIRGGAVLDGTEIAALLISKSSGLLKVGDVILGLNIFIFAAAAWALGVEPALYSMLTYLAASRTVDFLVYGIEEYHGMIIVSARSEAIRAAILHDLHRGVTIYEGRGGYGRHGASDAAQEILFCVVTRLEIPRVRNIVEEHDPSAFVVTHQITDVRGGLVKRSLSH